MPGGPCEFTRVPGPMPGTDLGTQSVGAAFALVNLKSGMCIVCNSGINQKWQLVVGEVPGFLRVVSANHARGDFCLDNGDTLIPGAVSIIWDCEPGNINQLWRHA